MRQFAWHLVDAAAARCPNCRRARRPPGAVRALRSAPKPPMTPPTSPLPQLASRANRTVVGVPPQPSPRDLQQAADAMKGNAKRAGAGVSGKYIVLILMLGGLLYVYADSGAGRGERVRGRGSPTHRVGPGGNRLHLPAHRLAAPPARPPPPSSSLCQRGCAPAPQQRRLWAPTPWYLPPTPPAHPPSHPLHSAPPSHSSLQWAGGG